MDISIKAVIFDWAWTLVDLVDEDDRRPFSRIFEFLRDRGILLPDFDECYRTYQELFYPMIHDSQETCREACFEFVLNFLLCRYSIDISGKTTVREILMAYYKEVYSVRKVFPDSIPTLKALQASGIRMGIISNTTNPGFMKDYEREQMGLDPFFEFSIYSSEFPYRKPHASIFRLAIAKLGLLPKEIFYVGDSLHNDVAGAQGVGMLAAWLNRDQSALSGPIVPDFQFQTLTDLLDLIPIEV
ncbi:MAG: HAD family hydrolase [Nitrospinaceae bacterium]